jgi:cytolysin (calcineurin-like family phosphatase)
MDYKLWKNIAKPILPITYEVVGNHDRIVGNKKYSEQTKADQSWQNYFTLPTTGPAGYDEFTYSFDVGNSHFVVLDTEKPKEHKIGQDQLDWLEKDLAANQKDNTFIFYHEPAFPMSYKIGQSLDVHKNYRDALWTIIDKYNVTAVFNGHEHIFSRQSIESDDFPAAKNEIYQFIIGNTDALEKQDVVIGSQVDYYHKGHNFVMVNVDGKEITVNLFSVDGELVNSFNFSK